MQNWQDGHTHSYPFVYQVEIWHTCKHSMHNVETRSHPEMVGDMSRVNLNFDLSKIPFVHF